MISEASIKAIISFAPRSGKKSIELSDGGERGAGRLTLRVQINPDRVSAEWYAFFVRDHRRQKVKLGSYPIMSLATARKTFREEYAPTISVGGNPVSKNIRRHHKGPAGGATVTEPFRAYVESVKSAGKRSWKDIERILLSEKCGAAASIGE